MEYLLELLNKVQLVAPLPIFHQEVIVVQNAGMQHWLNMSIAKTRGISMNCNYALPAQFLWKLARTIASEDEVPEQSPYSREVLCWRIYRLLGTKNIIDDPVFTTVSQYWQSAEITQFEQEQACLKRYQLAMQLADLFEQYLIFRPDWLNHWQAGETSLPDEYITTALNDDVIAIIQWQAKLWLALQNEVPYNPTTLIAQACENLTRYQHKLPKRISFFGLNAMAPMWLDFIHQVSEFTEVHFFHLNPCADYWGDIRSEKQAFKNITHWTEGFDDITLSVGNPLLANLGQQGREFLALLQHYSTYQFDVFDLAPSHAEQSSHRLLTAIQHDILTLSDARESATRLIDDSLIITSAHSALREVQGLHDWLLHQFNQHPDLTPKDVLVMCPQIENYAPYVDAVFARGWQELSDDIPPLPCSIADRVSKDAEPIVAAFLGLLSLPDSRFQVSQLLGFLRIEAVQQKFSLTRDELDKIAHWLDQANIYWGLNNEHKQSVLNSEQVSEQFTWQQGLSKLMRGFAYADQQSLYQNQVLLPTIEGSDAVLLGQLMLVLEQLQWHAAALKQPRTALQWQTYLHQLVDDCFAGTDLHQVDFINQAIENVVEYCQTAEFEAEIPLSIIQEYLDHHFSQPDPGRQFMVGQVTFCSMLPMRSIPFKVIAVLGLNDGDFPRQRKPQAFDLMQQTPSRVGDRSRRGDDRYLFLEALISARDTLYLSYQGRNIKNNSERQPSLVLKELMSYLDDAYGWQSDVSKDNTDIRQLPMQAFSEKNYLGAWPSFDGKWLNLVNKTSALEETTLVLPNTEQQTLDESSKVITLSQLLAFFVHPAKYFAEHKLDLYLNNQELILDDNEPFSVNQLTSYLYREGLLNIQLNNDLSVAEKQTAMSDYQQTLLLSGELPDLPSTTELLEGWQQDSDDFAQTLLSYHVNDVVTIEVVLPITVAYQGIHIEVSLVLNIPVVEQAIIVYRSSRAKAKDMLTMGLYQLALQQVVVGKAKVSSANELKILSQVDKTLGIYFDTKAQKVVQYQMATFEQPQALLNLLLNTYYSGQKQALLVNAALGEKLCQLLSRAAKKSNKVSASSNHSSDNTSNDPASAFDQKTFEQFWLDPNSPAALGADPYMKYFWPNVPQINQHYALLEALYMPIMSGAKKLK